MHIMMSKEQFKELKKKASSSESDVKMKVKEDKDDENRGTIEFPDAIVEYFYNTLEGRLYIQTIKRITLAAYVAGDNIITEYLIAKLSEIPTPEKNGDKEGKKEEPETVNQ